MSNKLEQLQNYKERKRLKKRKREKLRQKLLGVDKKKKKKKKHKCVDSSCKHKKHHKRHHKKRKHSSSGDMDVERSQEVEKEEAVEHRKKEFEEIDDEGSIGDVFEDAKVFKNMFCKTVGNSQYRSNTLYYLVEIIALTKQIYVPLTYYQPLCALV